MCLWGTLCFAHEVSCSIIALRLNETHDPFCVFVLRKERGGGRHRAFLSLSARTRLFLLSCISTTRIFRRVLCVFVCLNRFMFMPFFSGVLRVTFRCTWRREQPIKFEGNYRSFLDDDAGKGSTETGRRKPNIRFFYLMVMGAVVPFP